MRTTLLLFTGSYPYAVAAENTFLPQEIAVLRRYFDRVILVPISVGGARASIDGANVSVDTSYASHRTSLPRRAARILTGLLDKRLWRDVAPNLAVFLRRPRGLVRSFRAYADARSAESWVRRQDGLPWSDCVFYTWWFEGTTLGLATASQAAGVPVVTRVHGRDVYEYRHDPPRIPFRWPSLSVVSLVFSASHAGARYLAERYPEFSEKIRVSLLGTNDPVGGNEPSTDGMFRIVSCSVLLPVKRVDLMIRGVAEAGKTYSDRRFQWTHIGVGPDREALESLAAALMPANVTHRFIHYRGDDALFEYYRTHPADVFMNTSASEGTPVTIMEAISMGMPVIATAVGGNPEIVGPENGLVIAANPTPADIAAAIGTLLEKPERRAALRAGSREKWRTTYSAERNYSAFAETIRAL